MRENLSDKTLEREISPLSPPSVNLSNSIQENSDQEIHISKSTSKLFLEFYDFCNILNVYAEKRRLTNIHRNHWQKITRSIDKSLTEEIETEKKTYFIGDWQGFSDNLSNVISMGFENLQQLDVK